MGARVPVIGVLTPYTGGFYYGAILQGIVRAAASRGARVVALQTTALDLCSTNVSKTMSRSVSDALAVGAVSGWIAVNEFDHPEFVERLAGRGAPIVYVSQCPEGGAPCAVLPDNVGGMAAAVRHLIDHGHRRIAFAGSPSQHDLRERYEGYLLAHRAAGIPVEPELYLRSERCLEFDGQELGKRLVEAKMPCTAVAAGTDKMALGILSVVRAAGYEVPSDVAIVGFDDLENSQYLDPPLTTVKQSFNLLATTAAGILLDHMQEGKELPGIVRTSSAFVQRKSCGCSATMTISPMAEWPVRIPQSQRSLTEALLEIAGSWRLSPVSPADWPGAQRIAEHLAAVARGDHAQGARSLDGAWDGFLEVNRDLESVEKALGLLEDTARDWCPEMTTHQALRRTLRDLRVELLRRWRISEQERSRYYAFLAEATGKIRYALSSFRTTATELAWMRWTHARYGCLALWHDGALEGGPRSLDVVSEYVSASGPECSAKGSCAAASFPPPRLFEIMAGLGSEFLLTIAPVTGQGAGRGVLAVIAPVAIELLDHTGNVGDWAAQIGAWLESDETERRRLQEAYADPLTGLLNRVGLLAMLREMSADAEHRAFAVLFLDLDNFKNINDSLGHDAGDELLMEIARRLEDTVPSGATLARLGGDEFAIVLPEVSVEADVWSVVTHIQRSLQEPFSLKGDPVFTSCSIGVAFSGEGDFSATELLRDADTAMYRAKLQGRARCEVFHGGMHTQAVERLRMDSRLRSALENGEFTLVYQPIVSLASDRVVGVEALIRWNHPQRGSLLPARFLAVAEEVGLAIPISEWVIRTACRQAKAWQLSDEPPVYVNVNVPSQHLQSQGFVELLERVLRETELPPQALGVELVESSLVSREKETVRVLTRLKEMGIRVAIDDFGTGYSSLSYLKHFPVSVLKIDRSFIQNVPVDTHDAAITRAIITMAHGLGLTVVAEGVETEAQLEFLREQGCDFVQGFLLSRPMAAEDAYLAGSDWHCPRRATS